MALTVVLGAGVASQSGDDDARVVTSAGNGTPASSAPERTQEPAAPSTSKAPAVAPLLMPAAGGDGDSWKDRSGRELRLGLVNAPETNECFGSQATARRKALVASGFRVRTYATDTYGRGVSIVALPDGRNLNVLLAREGYADDRYLARFRHENEPLARQLDAAFAEAKAAKRGLWGACGSRTTKAPAPAPPAAAPRTPAPARPAARCHPDYATCIPIKGDGSGRGAANDLDCPEIGKLVRLQRIGVDPYRLDADRDGTGCDSFG